MTNEEKIMRLEFFCNTNEAKAQEIGEQYSQEYDNCDLETSYDECCESAFAMAEWKDNNPSKELVSKIFELSKEYISYGSVLDINGNVISPEDWILEQLNNE